MTVAVDRASTAARACCSGYAVEPLPPGAVDAGAERAERARSGGAGRGDPERARRAAVAAAPHRAGAARHGRQAVAGAVREGAGEGAGSRSADPLAGPQGGAVQDRGRAGRRGCPASRCPTAGASIVVTVARRDIIESYERACEAAGAHAGHRRSRDAQPDQRGARRATAARAGGRLAARARRRRLQHARGRSRRATSIFFRTRPSETRRRPGRPRAPDGDVSRGSARRRRLRARGARGRVAARRRRGRAAPARARRAARHARSSRSISAAPWRCAIASPRRRSCSTALGAGDRRASCGSGWRRCCGPISRPGRSTTSAPSTSLLALAGADRARDDRVQRRPDRDAVAAQHRAVVAHRRAIAPRRTRLTRRGGAHPRGRSTRTSWRSSSTPRRKPTR